jgi:hypothetical protein
MKELKVYLWDEYVDPKTSRLARWPIGAMAYLVVAAHSPHEAALFLRRQGRDASSPRVMHVGPIGGNLAFTEGARLALSQPGTPFWAAPAIRNPNASRLGIGKAAWKPLLFHADQE